MRSMTYFAQKHGLGAEFNLLIETFYELEAKLV